MKEGLTEQEVVERLAGRLGWKPIKTTTGLWVTRLPDGSNSWSYETEDGVRQLIYLKNRNLLESRDALAPVMEGMTNKEWQKLDKYLASSPGSGASYDGKPDRLNGEQHWTRWLLKLPPRDLAFAIAEALEEVRAATMTEKGER